MSYCKNGLFVNHFGLVKDIQREWARTFFEMWTTIPEVFPFFKRERSKSHDRLDASAPPSPRRNPALRKSTRSQPTLHVTMDKSAYRPGDLVVATIDVRNDGPTAIKAGTNASNRSLLDAVLMEDLLVEVKGIERVDPQWLVTPKAPPGSKQRRGLPHSSDSLCIQSFILHCS